MKTGDHTLSLSSARPEECGNWRARCSCGKFSIPAKTRDEARARHQKHFDEENAREQMGREI